MFLMVLKSVILAWGTGTLHHGDRDLLLSLFLGLFLPPLLSGTQLVSSPVLGNFPSQEKTDSRNTLEVSGWRVWTSSLYLQIKYSGREMAMLPRTEVEAKQMTYHPRIPAWQGGGVGGAGQQRYSLQQRLRKSLVSNTKNQQQSANRTQHKSVSSSTGIQHRGSNCKLQKKLLVRGSQHIISKHQAHMLALC